VFLVLAELARTVLLQLGPLEGVHLLLLDDLVGLAHLERHEFGFVQFRQVAHEHGADQLLHAVQSDDLHIQDALDFVEDFLWNVTADTQHLLERAS